MKIDAVIGPLPQYLHDFSAEPFSAFASAPEKIFFEDAGIKSGG